MNPVKRLFAYFEEYYAYERMTYLRYAGLVGGICYPCFTWFISILFRIPMRTCRYA